MKNIELPEWWAIGLLRLIDEYNKIEVVDTKSEQEKTGKAAEIVGYAGTIILHMDKDLKPKVSRKDIDYIDHDDDYVEYSITYKMALPPDAAPEKGERNFAPHQIDGACDIKDLKNIRWSEADVEDVIDYVVQNHGR